MASQPCRSSEHSSTSPRDPRDEHPDGSNPTRTPSLADLIASSLARSDSAQASRRHVLGAALGSTAAFLLGGGRAMARPSLASVLTASPLIGFTQVPTSDADTVVVPPGYTFDILVPWGTPLFGDAAEFREDASNSAADQARQVGFNHDGMHFFPIGPKESSTRRGLLAINHEYSDANQIYSSAQGSKITPDAAGREQVAKALAAHGVTIVEVERALNGAWSHVVDSPFNRRITGTTPMAFSGPVALGHPLMRSSITPEPRGTLNNCSNGVTPWGTYLTCEENWNGYFGTDDPDWKPSQAQARYGVHAKGFEYHWHVAETRFDLAVNPNELHHFGWVVEIDPQEPTSTPIKRTALGRFKHESASLVESHGRVVVYSGDDENGEYLYKFVGDGTWKEHRANGRSPFDHGTLYAARFDDDGGGTWLPLVHGQGALTTENGWLDQADVLLRTRLAGDAIGATRLHRPEWVAVDERTSNVYVTLTNGSGHTSAVNSGRDPNPYGHIVRFAHADGDHTATEFTWEVFLLAGDPELDERVPAAQPAFGSPDGIWIDAERRLWILTDVSNASQNRADKGYATIGNNQMLCADPDTGAVRRFMTGPRGCEITGVIATPDGRTLFVNVQHPGESTTEWNRRNGAPSVDNPSAVSSWPYGRRPRPTTIAIRRLDGGRVGT